MKLDRIAVYQAIEIQTTPAKKTNVNTISADVVPGVEIDLTDHIITVSHADWDEDVIISTANMRYAVIKKIVFMAPKAKKKK